MRDSVYVPLLGGRRERNIEVLSADTASEFGTVKIVGDLIRFEAGSELKSLPLGIPFQFPVVVQYRDADDKVIDVPIFLTAINTPAGVQLTLPGGRVATDSALISPVSLGSQVSDPFVFETPPFVPQFFDESIFEQIFNAQNPEFLQAVIDAQGALPLAAVAATEANSAFEEAAAELELAAEAKEARDLATLQRSTADQNAKLLADLEAELLQVVNALLPKALADLSVANEAADQATGLVLALSSQLSSLKDVLLPVIEADFLIADTALNNFLVFNGLSLPASQHFDIPGIGPLIKSLSQDRDDKFEAREELLAKIDTLALQVEQAFVDQAEALSAFTAALATVATLEERFEQLSDVDFEELEKSVIELNAIAINSETVASILEGAAASAIGAPVPITDAFVEQLAGVFNALFIEKSDADIALIVAKETLDTAVAKYTSEIDALPDLEFDLVLANLALGIEASAGLEFNFNRATETEERELSVALAYDITLDLEFNAGLAVPLPFPFPDQEFAINVDETIERSGRVEFDGSALEGRANGALDRLAVWTDTFDFV